MKTCVVFCVALLTFTGGAHADPNVLYLSTYKEVQAAPAVQTFCKNFPKECRKSGSDTLVPLTPERRAELERVHLRVNTKFVYQTDMHLYGEDERWVLNTRHGDCEDFAIRKRNRLIKMGWPSSALLITIVRTPEKRMHALLIVRTREGDLVLDKTTHGPDPIRLWSDTSYEYVAQQSVHNPRRWVSLVHGPIDAADYQIVLWAGSK